jgi:hypothetical protein
MRVGAVWWLYFASFIRTHKGNPMVLGSGTTGTYTCSNARRKLGCKNIQGIRRESLEKQ